jgi:hypothetical protein
MHAAATAASREAPAAAAAARAATVAAHAAAARGSASQRVRQVRQHPYIRPSRQRGARLRTPSDDEDEVVGPAKVEERVKEEEKMDTGDAAKKEESEGETKNEDAMN